MAVPKIINTRVYLEYEKIGAAKSTKVESTKVVCVSWELASGNEKPDGEWIVEWDDMYGEASEDIRSARSEQGNYFALQREIDSAATNSAGPESLPAALEPPRQTESPKNENYDEPLPTGPLSTAKLLEFENGPNFREVQEDLSSFFSSRPIVQAPTQITPDSTSASKKTEVLFLLSADVEIPSTIKIYFTPTWTSPNTPPTILGQIHKSSFLTGHEGLYLAWAEKRLLDLKILEDIAKELELEGSRGTGQGRVKVGVEGGGMDEEAVRREGWMVGEEQVWVREKFLEVHPDEPLEAMDPLMGLGISSGLKLQTSSTITGSRHVGTPEDEEEEDLFALPLSPRSPDMSVSPFSMFRGEASGKSPQPSKLRQVESINTTALGMGFSEVTPTGSDITPTGHGATPTTAIRTAAPGAPPTPPREARVG